MTKTEIGAILYVLVIVVAGVISYYRERGDQ